MQNVFNVNTFNTNGAGIFNLLAQGKAEGQRESRGPG